MICPNCGQKVPGNAKFCPYCGMKVKTDRVKKHDKFLKTKIKVVAIAVVGILLFSLLILNKSSKIKHPSKSSIATTLSPSKTKNSTEATLNENYVFLIPYRNGDRWGFCDRNKHIVIKPIYDYVLPFSEGLAYVEINGRAGYINSEGHMVIKPIYSTLYSGFPDPKMAKLCSFNEGLAYVGAENGMGFINKKGRLVFTLDPNYEEINPFDEGLALVEVGGINDTFGFIDKNGRMTIKPVFYDAKSFSEGLAAVQFPNGGYGFIDTKGNTTIKPIYVMAESFSEGLAAIQIEIDGKLGCGYINKKGEMVIRPKTIYINARSFSEGLAPVEEQTDDGFKWGYIDKNGNMVIKPRFGDAFPFKGGLARVQLDLKWGFINKEGKIVVKPIYASVGDFNEGYAPVQAWTSKGLQCGVIDTKGNMVIKPEYTNISDFKNGIALVMYESKTGYKTGYIDTKGTQFWEDK